MEVDIYIKETEGSRELRIPWLPDKVKFTRNGTRMASYEVLDLGDVEMPSGSTLQDFGWESWFPGEGHRNLSFLRGEWQDPKKIQTLLSEWSEYGIPLRLIVTGTPINHDVYLVDYNVDYESGYGDYKYDIKFRRRREIKVTTTTNSGASGSSSAAGKTGTTYTVKTGDTLWGLAQKFYGSGAKYGTIYNANKTIIEEMSKKYGKSGSDGGHWIYPGTVLYIPGGSESTAASTASSASATTKTSSSSNSSGSGSDGKPPYAVVDSSGKTIRSNISTFSLAQGYYKANGGASKGWKIIDKNGSVAL